MEKKAISGFLFRGRRQVAPAAPVLANDNAAAAAAVAIPAGKRAPFSAYLRAPSSDKDEKISLPIYGASAALADLREERSLYPAPALHIAPNLSRKAETLRSSLFLPVITPGLKEWMKRQTVYIEGLSNRERNILESYTYHGDNLVNGYLRGTLGDLKELFNAMRKDRTIPLAYAFYDQFDRFKRLKTPTGEERLKFLPPESWHLLDYGNVNSETGSYREGDEELDMEMFDTIIKDNIEFFRNPASIASLLKQYSEDIIGIINRSPRLKRDIIVYRGMKSETHLKSLTYKTPDFLSTTLDPQSVLEFTEAHIDPVSGRTVNCCVYEITVHRRVPCIYLQRVSRYGGEFEVLIPPGIELTVGRTIQLRVAPAERIPTAAAMLLGPREKLVAVIPASAALAERRRTARRSSSDTVAAAGAGAGAAPWERKAEKKKRREWRRTTMRRPTTSPGSDD